MSELAMTTAVASPAEPDGAPRLAVLDIQRGIAILGILFMNINDMGGPLTGSFVNDPRLLGRSRADQVAWWLREVLANGTARCLLEMLFGVGMAILTDRAATRMGSWRVLRAYAWRNLVLFAFGLIHLFVLLWPGDILHTYGLASIVAVLFRRCKPRLLLTVGLVGATLQLLLGSGFVLYSNHQQGLERALTTRAATGAVLTLAERKQLAAAHKATVDRDKSRAETRALVAAEDRARSGSPRTWVQAAWDAILYIQAQFVEIFSIWEAAGTMLIGAALYRWGIIQGERSRRFYLLMTPVAYLIGLGLRVWAAYATTRFAHDASLANLAYPAGEYARLLTTLGHVGLVNLMLASAGGARLLRPFAAAGRTALTVYVAQTLVCLWVLYPPWGFALYGHEGWAALMATALAIDAALLVGANWWTRRFAIAPVEWAWRSILARRPLPFRRDLSVALAGAIRSS